MQRVKYILFISGFISQFGLSQSYFQLDRPRIKNFSKTVYQADNQNWGIGQGKDGSLYFANNKGLLTFNGITWNLYPMPKNTIVRSIEVSNSGKIFVGSYEEFGYWEKDKTGGMNYTSLKSLLKDYNFHNEDIWKIITHNGITYFQSFSVIFAFNGSKVEVINPPGLITCFSEVGDKLYLIVTDHGLFELSNQKIISVDNSSFFRQKMIRVILPYAKGKMLIASSDEGIFLYDSTGLLTPWGNDQKSAEYKSNSINRGTATKDGWFIIGTILNGLFVFDRSGNIVFHISKQNGLQNNTVLSVFIDEDGYLWAGLDNGIDLINLTSTVTFYNDIAGKLGSVYSILLRNDYLYAGTNQGLFYSKFEPVKGTVKLDFQFIENSQGQVWSLADFNNQLFCGHNDRTYEIRETKILPLSPVSGGFSFCIFHQGSEDYLLQCTYTNLVLYKMQSGKWIFDHRIENFLNPIRYIEVDHLGNIWASHLQRGIYRIRLTQDLASVAESEYYGIKKGFASDYHINVFKLQNRVVFTNEGYVYSYNDLYDTITKFDFIENQIIKNSYVRSIIYAGNQNYWFVTEKNLDLYGFPTGKVILKKSYSFELFDDKLIRNNEYIFSIDSARWIVCLENGIALINSGSEQDIILNKKAIIDKIISQGRREIVLAPGIENGEKLSSIPFSQNSIVFYFSCPVFDSKLNFLVKLEGIDKDWMKVDQSYYKYDRLPWGTYTFNVKAQDGKGNFSQLSSFSFIIKSPWYWAGWLKVVYFSFIILLIFVIRFYFLRRLKHQEIRLGIQKERELIKLKNEKLQAEVQYKSMQLANTTYSITKKNELLMEIKRLLIRSIKNMDSKGQFKEIQKLLDQNITNDDDWKIFESNFEQAHEEFLLRIKKQYTNLTPSDLKLCAFIRMNLPSKKIAPLLGISIRGVENHRHRLRKKMELDRYINLTEYLMEF